MLIQRHIFHFSNGCNICKRLRRTLKCLLSVCISSITQEGSFKKKKKINILVIVLKLYFSKISVVFFLAGSSHRTYKSEIYTKNILNARQWCHNSFKGGYWRKRFKDYIIIYRYIQCCTYTVRHPSVRYWKIELYWKISPILKIHPFLYFLVLSREYLPNTTMGEGGAFECMRGRMGIPIFSGNGVFFGLSLEKISRESREKGVFL